MDADATTLPKPDTELRDRVRGTLVRLSHTGALPTLPAAATAALVIARDPDASVADLCQVVRTDVGLSARVMRLANSAAVARYTPARTLRDAVVTIGLRKTCDVLVAATTRSMLGPAPEAEGLWNHALAVAVASEELARLTNCRDPGGAFLPGLFHDVGRIAFMLADPTAPTVIEALAASTHEQRSVLEREWYGFDHAEAGAILTADWGLTAEQCNAIRWHHAPAQAGPGRTLAGILNVADGVAYTLGCGSGDERPASDSFASLGLAAEDEAAFLERVQAAYAHHREVLA